MGASEWISLAIAIATVFSVYIIMRTNRDFVMKDNGARDERILNMQDSLKHAHDKIRELYEKNSDMKELLGRMDTKLEYIEKQMDDIKNMLESMAGGKSK